MCKVAISLASIAIAKESLFGISIAKLSVNGPWVPQVALLVTSRVTLAV